MERSTLVVWCFLATLAVSDSALEIRPRGPTFIKAIGTSMVLTCDDSQAAPGSRIVWKDPRNNDIADNSRQRIYVERDQRSSRLYVRRIQSRDRGRYQCLRMQGGTKRDEKTVTISIFKDITFDNAPSPQNPPIHRDVIIECRVSAEPKADVSWRFRNRNIEPSARYSIEPNGLKIRNVTRQDNGEYTCRAEVKDEGRYNERTITVTVHIPPVITMRLVNVDGVEGSFYNLSCRGTGFPQPKYEFRKNNQRWIPRDIGRIKVDADAGRVEFKPVHKSDEGIYTCVAINDVGSANTSANVRVLVPARIHDLRNITQNENIAATLSCRSYGDPAPKMKFRKIGSMHEFNASNDRGRILLRESTGRLDLEFKKLRPVDSGNYSCTSENQAGSHSAVGAVVVNYKPRFGRDHARRVFIWPGTTHNITCHAHAYPVAQIEWWRRDIRLGNNQTYHIFVTNSRSNLQMLVKESDRSWIFGRYSCRARNRLGNARIEIDIIEAKVPQGRPTVRVKETSPNMVVLEVEPPRHNGGKEVSGYRVEFGRKMTDYAVGYKLSRVEPPPGARSIGRRPELEKDELVIENLKPETQYVFTVRAKNDVGVGDSTEIKATTTSIRPPFPIQVISPRHGDDSHSYTLVWANPKTGGKPIEKYTIKYRRVDNKTRSALDHWRTIVINDDPHRPISKYYLGGLTPLTRYQVEIKVDNYMGASADTSFVFVTSEVKPGSRPVREAALGLWTMVAIAVGVILVIIIVIDVSCYFLSGCGITMCICVKLCDRQPTDADDTAELKETNNRNNDVEAPPTQQQQQQQPASHPPATQQDDRPATKQSLAEKDAAAAAAAAKLAKEHELEKKVLEPRENEPLIRGHQDSGRPQQEDRQEDIEEKRPLMSEVEPRADADQKDVEDHHPYHQPEQQQQQSYRELSDDNPIENDVEHTTDDDIIPAAGEKSASADSGAEEIGSPEQLAVHGTGHPMAVESPDQGWADSGKDSPIQTEDSGKNSSPHEDSPTSGQEEKTTKTAVMSEHDNTETKVSSGEGQQHEEVATETLVDI